MLSLLKGSLLSNIKFMSPWNVGVVVGSSGLLKVINHLGWYRCGPGVRNVYTVKTTPSVLTYTFNTRFCKDIRRTLKLKVNKQITDGVAAAYIHKSSSVKLNNGDTMDRSDLLLKEYYELVLYRKLANITVQTFEKDSERILRDVDHEVNSLVNNLGISSWDSQVVDFQRIAMDTQVENGSINISSIDYSQIKVGGLESQLKKLVKHVFLTRMISKDTFNKLGIEHTKGVILYGPPGCGKTRLIRQISSLFGIKNVTIINGPELINSYYGKTEENIRKCFNDAVAKPHELHLIIFDEFDSLAGKRGSGRSEEMISRIVGQLLTLMDGVKKMDNIIVFGLTNRLDMIDPALLRPGRFSLHLKIDLPDERGRYEILKIHTVNLYQNEIISDDVDLEALSFLTAGFSGADLESLVQKTVQKKLAKQIDYGNVSGSVERLDNISITHDDFVDVINKIRTSK